MNLETEQIEELLRNMRPCPISRELNHRIEAAVSHSVAHDPVQHAIASTRPSPLPADLALRLEKSLSRVPHPDTHKVVHFPATCAHPTAPAWRKYAAAAAVALLGATSALLVPSTPKNQPIAASPLPTHPLSITPANPALIPAGYQQGLSEAKDEGIVWQPKQGPQRRLKLVFRELVTLHDAAGRTYQVERPRIQYLLVPAKID